MTSPMSTGDIGSRLQAHRIAVSAEEVEQLTTFLNLLEQWNRVHNLTGLRDREQLIERHLIESLALRDLVRGPAAADLGSGGGLPGVPLAIALPDVAFTLIESRRKRASFLRHVATTLGLPNVTVAHARAESVTSGPFATVLARAFAAPAELVAIARPLLAPGGRLLVLTSKTKAGEIAAAAEDFDMLALPASVGAMQSRIVALELEALP